MPDTIRKDATFDDFWATVCGSDREENHLKCCCFAAWNHARKEVNGVHYEALMDVRADLELMRLRWGDAAEAAQECFEYLEGNIPYEDVLDMQAKYPFLRIEYDYTGRV